MNKEMTLREPRVKSDSDSEMSNFIFFEEESPNTTGRICSLVKG